MLRLAAALLLGTALGTAAVLLASGRFSQAPPEVPSSLESSAQAPFAAESAPELDAQAAYAEPAAALVALARRSPAAAFAELEALGPASRRTALPAVARA